MKKILALFALVLIFLYPFQVFAAWNIETKIKGHKYSDGSRLLIMTVHGISDGTDPAPFNFSTYLSGNTVSLPMSSIRNGEIYAIETGSGVTLPDNAWTLSISNAPVSGVTGADIIGISGVTYTKETIYKANTDLGINAILTGGDIILDIGDIGSSGDEIYIRILVNN